MRTRIQIFVELGHNWLPLSWNPAQAGISTSQAGSGSAEKERRRAPLVWRWPGIAPEPLQNRLPGHLPKGERKGVHGSANLKLQNESQRFPFSTTARRSKQRRGIAARPSIAMDKNRYNQVPQFVGRETPAFRAPQTPATRAPGRMRPPKYTSCAMNFYKSGEGGPTGTGPANDRRFRTDQSSSPICGARNSSVSSPTNPLPCDHHAANDANDAFGISCITTPQKSPPTQPQKTFPRSTLLPQHVPSLRVPFPGHPPKPLTTHFVRQTQLR